ncbi:MAG: TlpA family protein disulfide reductase [Chloroflexi bacterium]|nr:TlpA family protein disulfide reductase [Chloroflexota bacterium]
MSAVVKMVLSIVLLISLLVAGCAGASGTPARLGEKAPDFQLKSLDGSSVSLSGLQGSPVLINFWATWCPPCREEMPYLQKIHDKYSSKGLKMLAIDIGESPDKVKDFLASNNLSLPVLLDSRGSVSGRYSVGAIPTTFLIDKNGIIQEKVIGAFPNVEAIERSLKKIMP